MNILLNSNNVTFRLHFTMQIHWTALFPFLLLLPSIKAHVRYDLVMSFCMIQSGDFLCTIRQIFLVRYERWVLFLYDINLRATHTMTLSIRGVTISIYLISRAMDSIR